MNSEVPSAVNWGSGMFFAMAIKEVCCSFRIIKEGFKVNNTLCFNWVLSFKLPNAAHAVLGRLILCVCTWTGLISWFHKRNDKTKQSNLATKENILQFETWIISVKYLSILNPLCSPFCRVWRRPRRRLWRLSSAGWWGWCVDVWAGEGLCCHRCLSLLQGTSLTSHPRPRPHSYLSPQILLL